MKDIKTLKQCLIAIAYHEYFADKKLSIYMGHY